MPTVRPNWKYSADKATITITSPNDGSNILAPLPVGWPDGIRMTDR